MTRTTAYRISSTTLRLNTPLKRTTVRFSWGKFYYLCSNFLEKLFSRRKRMLFLRARSSNTSKSCKNTLGGTSKAKALFWEIFRKVKNNLDRELRMWAKGWNLLMFIILVEQALSTLKRFFHKKLLGIPLCHRWIWRPDTKNPKWLMFGIVDIVYCWFVLGLKIRSIPSRRSSRKTGRRSSSSKHYMLRSLRASQSMSKSSESVLRMSKRIS